MQETKIRTSGDDDPPTERPQWVRLVAIAVALAMLAGFVIAAVQSVTSSGADPDPNPGGASGSSSEPDFSLTDEEAIERFQELDELRINAYESGDMSLVTTFTGPGPLRLRTMEELRRLRRDNVTASPKLQMEELRVVSNTPTQVDFRQTVIVDIVFFDEEGKDVTTKGGEERQVIDWVLRYHDQGWLWTEATVIEAEPVE